MANQVTRNNHYVPVWYQRGFLGPDQSQLHHLDTAPDQKALPDGRRVPMKALHKWGPKRCFFEFDLYTTHFGAVVNDEIEKYLFGSIDVTGAKAVRAFIGGNSSAIHESFSDFFKYLDAQKLRTPKGLDWIKSRYPALSQLQLMREMQGLRLMHCTMWTEGVREVVSAEESDVKFIVTDHPVTVYNAALPPTSPECSYPEDPLIELVGSQTVFALDANTCLILTHLEYAQEPRPSNMTTPRTHARYRGQSLVRTDAFIRKRKLTRDEVIAINHLLKSRARRYLAAAKQEWLYPEKSFTGGWDDIAKVLLPRDDLWRFGGDIYIGYEDGTTHHQDSFGRTSGAHKYLQRKKRQSDLGPNDACGCGSGRKFKQCCQRLPEDDRPSWEVYGIRERNLMFCHAVQDILGLTKGKTWNDVRRELSDDHVKRIHEAFASLWPEDTDLAEMLPRPTQSVVRAVYLGAPDARTIEATVTGWLAYFDEVVIAHPFVNPIRVRSKFSPTESPSQHKEQALKNVLLLLLLEPYIDAGLVHLIPDPSDFNSDFGRSVLKMAEERTAGWEPNEEDAEKFENLARDDLRRSLSRLPENALRQHIRDHLPETASKDVDQVIAHMKAELAADPYALLQPIELGEQSGQLQIIKGYGLEVAMYLASLTGSVIYTDLSAHWQQLHRHTSASQTAMDSAWKPVVDSWQEISFPIDINVETAFLARRTGKFGEMRAAIRLAVEAIRQPLTSPQPSQLASQLIRAAQLMCREWARSAEGFRLEGRMEVSFPSGGFERNDVRRLLLTFGRARTVRPIPMALFVRIYMPEKSGGD